MILLLHIAFGIATIISGIAAIATLQQRWLNGISLGLSATFVSGFGLLFMNPAVLTHLCVSGLVFSAVSIALYAVAKRRIALAAQSTI